MEKTLGGERLGGGNKNKQHLHNYERSTHNLSTDFKTAMSCGTLVPFYCNIGLNGDSFDFDLNSMVRTIPTVGPLFGTFKLQIDLFQIPIRLYNGIMHNNPLNIGMNISQVKFPKIQLIASADKERTMQENMQYAKHANNSLLKYLGISGLGTYTGPDGQFKREFNALPTLGYYDTVKCYYANKMETNAWMITAELKQGVPYLDNVIGEHKGRHFTFDFDKTNSTWQDKGRWLTVGDTIQFTGENLNPKVIYDTRHGIQLQVAIDRGDYKVLKSEPTIITVELQKREKELAENGFCFKEVGNNTQWAREIKLQEFPLDNIDRMRYDILKEMQLGVPFMIKESEHDYLPYGALVGIMPDGYTVNAADQNGLMLKTYQSDLFNNWIKTDWIDGANGIAEITKIDTTDGLYLDTLNIMQKVYNQLNRVAISGGTLEDWEEVTWGEEAVRRAESPIYMGGMASEIVFEEVVSTADTTDENKLGTLAGKGTLMGKKGGRVIIKPKEPVIIMGIVSITPRLNYTQGNAWYNTELDNLDDLHKPAYDTIGFQELITEQMHWADAEVNAQGEVIRKSAGKVPAWLNYQTDVDKAYSSFAEPNEQGFMVLNRNYEMEFDDATRTCRIKDLTTYIDPTKYNYAFADTRLNAQNFWVQISGHIEARRKMSAHNIPNL